MTTDYTPRRVVSLQPSATVILKELGQLDRLVACTRYCADVCPEVRAGDRLMVADSWTAQAAEILAARPDLVIAAVPYQEKALAEILKSGARFLGLAPKTLADIYADIATIAGVVDARERGQQIITGMQKEIGLVAARARRGAAPQRVFCEEWGKPILRSQPWVAELVEAAGGEFLGPPGQQTTADAVREAAPEVIIAAWCGAGDRVPLEKIILERGWEATPAAKSGRVFCIRDELLNTPAPTLLGGLRALAAALHPESFPQVLGLRAIAAPVV